MSLQSDFGKKIKNLRESVNVTQEELAEKIGIHRNSLVRIERGEGFASHETIEKIRDFFQISYSQLFDFNEQHNQDPYKAITLRLKELNKADLEYFQTTINAYLKAKKQNQ